MKPTEHDTLTVMCLGRDGSEFIYKGNRNTQLSELMNDYSDHISTEHELVGFFFDGRRVHEWHTLNELELEDGDIIHTVRSVGGDILLNVKGQDGYEASFTMDKCSRLEKLMDFYCRRYCLDITQVVFLFNGSLIRADQTPDELHMRYEDEIYVVSYDQIAHIELKTKCQMATDDDNSDSKLWPDLETKAFINIMLDEVALLTSRYGNMSKDVWSSMTTELNAITNRSYKKEQLKAKMHSLHAMYHEFYSLLQNTGFKWNPETNTITATAEVWQNYLQANDKTAQFQKKGCDHYKLLGIIFNNKNANEVFHYSSTNDPKNTNDENELDNQYLNVVRGSHVQDDMQEFECVTCNVKRKIPSKDHRLMNECMSRAERYWGKSVEATSFVTLDCSLTKCVAALEEIEDISNDIYVKALKMFKDSDWREMFIAMSNDRRRGWLCSL